MSTPPILPEHYENPWDYVAASLPSLADRLPTYRAAYARYGGLVEANVERPRREDLYPEHTYAGQQAGILWEGQVQIRIRLHQHRLHRQSLEVQRHEQALHHAFRNWLTALGKQHRFERPYDARYCHMLYQVMGAIEQEMKGEPEKSAENSSPPVD